MTIQAVTTGIMVSSLTIVVIVIVRGAAQQILKVNVTIRLRTKVISKVTQQHVIMFNQSDRRLVLIF